MQPVQSGYSGICLSDEEQAQLKSLVEQCQQLGLTERPDALGKGDCDYGLSDEITLLRFLQGRSFDVPGTIKQLQAARAIRNSVNVVAAYDTISVDTFEKTRYIYPHWTGRRDKAGYPLCIFDLDRLDQAALKQYGKAAESGVNLDSLIFHDYLTRFVLPLCSVARDRPNPESTVTSAVYLIDISKVTLTHGWSLRNYAQGVSTLLATCYPEVIHQIYALNVSPLFRKIWGILSKWCDPRTAAKLIMVPAAEVDSTLQSFIDIDSIPAQFGGKLDFKHGMPVNLDEGLVKALNWNVATPGTVPIGPLKWSTDEDGEMVVLATGVVKDQQRQEVVATTA
ncbi:hypothetical protein S40288_07532 [Stachybotrys chartarum IBT 40288]|nr:hypothetical protein S40288_07532 [Stachybotrys chartarum IBT 40288]